MTVKNTAPLIRRLRSFRFIDSTLHGPAHWSRVHRFGHMLCDHLQIGSAGRQCVEVFAWTHDLARKDDFGGNLHAIEGADYLDTVLPAVFPGLTSDQAEMVRIAVRYHSDSMVAEEAYFKGLLDHVPWDEDTLVYTLGACWDADRLDLLRLNRPPHPRLMSTPAWEDVLPYALRVHRLRSGAY